MNTLTAASRNPSDANSDAELVGMAIAGNDLAFAKIMRRYNRLLFRTARSILKSDDETQETLMPAVWRATRWPGIVLGPGTVDCWGGARAACRVLIIHRPYASQALCGTKKCFSAFWRTRWG